MTDIALIKFRPGDLAGPIMHRTKTTPDGDLDGSPSLTAKRDLARWYAVVAATEDAVRSRIADGAVDRDETVRRAALIAAAASAPPPPGAPWTPVWMGVWDAVKLDDAHEQHGLLREDAEALALRIRDAPAVEQACLADMVERYWLRAESLDLEVALQLAGLIDADGEGG